MIENFDSKYLQKFEYETTINSDGTIAGACELGKAEIQMINDSNEYSTLKGQWISTIHGSFYVDSVEPVQEKVNIKLVCKDIKYKLDTKYDSSLYTWPMTLKQWRNAIFTNCGVTYDNSDFPHSSMVLNSEPYIGDNPSNRSVISQIAQAGCSFVVTDASDKFYFKWFSNTSHTATDWLELTTEKESTSPVNVVVLGRGDVEDNVSWPEETPENPVEFRIDNNYILDPQIEGQDQRYDVIQAIYNRVNGFNYLIFNMRSQSIANKLNVNLGEIINYTDIWGNSLSAYIMSKKITWLGGDPTNPDNYEITLSAEEVKETSTNLNYSSSIQNRVLRVERTADKQSGQISDLVSQVQSVKNKESNDYQEMLGKFQAVDETLTDVEDIEHAVREIQTDTYTKTEIQQIANGTGVGGVKVSAVITESGTFDEDGMTYEKTGAKTKSTINEIGINVKDNNSKSLLFAGYVDENNTDYEEYVNQTIVGTDNIIVRNYLNIGSHTRIQDYASGTGIFVR